MTTPTITETGHGCHPTTDTSFGYNAHPPATDLPNTPFEALRVAYGMLLGEEDFRVLMGHPRGKLMLHNAWLHGRGAVWGLGAAQDGDTLTVQPGLAVDGWGRELRLTSSWCVSTSAWAQRWLDEQDTFVDCESVRVCLWVVAEHDACDGRSVPALADPCDVTRQHDAFSRTHESCRITMADARPAELTGYHRVRVLLGLDQVGDDDCAGREAQEAREELRRLPREESIRALLQLYQVLAAADEMDLAPLADDGGACPPLAPVPEEEAGVVLARVCLDIRAKGGCATVQGVELDPSVRPVLLPTRLIGELSLGPAPGLIGGHGHDDAGGPRLIRESVAWSADGTKLRFAVTAAIAPGSEEGTVQVSSLDDGGRGWADDDVERIQLSTDGREVRVFLDQRPKYDTVRVVVKGTGRFALFGVTPRVPFAGLQDGPPGTADDGHDTVVTMRLPSAAHHPTDPRRAQ